MSLLSHIPAYSPRVVRSRPSDSCSLGATSGSRNLVPIRRAAALGDQLPHLPDSTAQDGGQSAVISHISALRFLYTKYSNLDSTYLFEDFGSTRPNRGGLSTMPIESSESCGDHSMLGSSLIAMAFRTGSPMRLVILGHSQLLTTCRMSMATRW